MYNNSFSGNNTNKRLKIIFLVTILSFGAVANIFSVSLSSSSSSFAILKDAQALETKEYQSTSNIQKDDDIICNNFNLNANGLNNDDISESLKDQLKTNLAQTTEEIEGKDFDNSNTFGNDEKRFDSSDGDFAIICKNNNDNEQSIPTPPTPPTPPPEDDNVYVVWQDQSNGGDSDIFFRVSNDNGQTFEPPIDLSSNTGFSVGQQMIVSGNNVYVVWADESNGGDFDIFFRVSHDNGQTFEPPIDLSSNTAFSFSPQIIVSGNNVFVVWQDLSNGGDPDIFFRVSNDNGQTFEPPIDLSSNTGTSEGPQMIVSGNNVYVVWMDTSNGGDLDIFFRVSNDNGQTFEPPIDLSSNTGLSRFPQMIVSGNNVYVVWQDTSNGGDDDIFFRVSNDNGQTFEPPIDLSSNTGGSFGQQMIVSGNNVYVAWMDTSNGGDNDIFFRVSNDNGQTFEPPIDLSSNTGQSFTQQMIVSGNNIYVVWQDTSNGPDVDIFFRVSNDNGQTFEPIIDLSNNTGESDGQQMIVSGNNVYVVWTDNSNGPDRDIFFRVSNDNGQTFEPPLDISSNTGDSASPKMIVQ